MDTNRLFYVLFWITVYFGILILLFYSLISWILNSIRNKNEHKTQFNLTFLQIKLPKDNEIEIKTAEQMFASLSGIKKSAISAWLTGQYRFSFEIVSKQTGISFYVAVPDEIAQLVEKQINAAYPSAEIDIVNPHEIWDRGEFTRVCELRLKGAPYYPIKVYEDLQTDSLSAITSAMSKLNDKEVLAVQYVMQPASNSWRMSGKSFITNVKAKANNPDKKYNIDTSFLEGIEKKIKYPGFDVKIRLVAIAENSTAADSLIQNAATAFEQFTDVNYNKFVLKYAFSPQKLVDDFIYRRIRLSEWIIPIFNTHLYRNTALLNTQELATVFHFPNKNVETPNIVWLGSRRASAPVNIPSEGLYLGKSIFRGTEKKIFMKDKDRTRHFYIIGQTGTGKSVFLMSMALQDIINGEGLCVIDPHGTDVQELLEKIPEHRKKDVIYFDAAEEERPMGINLLEANSEEEKHMIVNSFIALLYKLYDPNKQGIMGPILERAIRNIMLTAMTDPNATMIDVMRLTIDEKYSKKFIPNIKDPLIKRYWTDEVANTSQQRKGETMGYFVSKFDRFVTDKTMRNILGQKKSSFNIAKIMEEKKILLVDLAKGKLGEENSNFIGLLLVPKILSAALERHKLLGKVDFPNFFLYVDEFQNFATPDFATILSEARKYKLNLVVAHQFVAQLTEDIKNAVFGNVGTMASFRIGIPDAEFMEQQFSPTFTKQDMANLPMGNSYVKLLVDGHPTPPFSMQVDWAAISAQTRSKELAEEIKETNRQKYGTPAEEVEAYVKERAGFEDEKEEDEEDIFGDSGMIRSKLPF